MHVVDQLVQEEEEDDKWVEVVIADVKEVDKQEVLDQYKNVWVFRKRKYQPVKV